MAEKATDRLLDLGIRLSYETDFCRLLESILSDAMELCNCDAGILYLKEEECLVFKILRNNSIKGYQGGDGKEMALPPLPLSGKSICARALLEDRAISVQDVKNCETYDFPGIRCFDVLTGYHTRSVLAVPMKNREGDMTGVVELLNAMDEKGNVGGFSPYAVHMLKSVASQASISIQNMMYARDIKSLFRSFVQVLSTAIDERTPYNATHTRNMVRCGVRFVDYLNKISRESGKEPVFSEAHKEEFLMSVWLHDIGKLVTPLGIMNKAERLRPEDLAELKNRFQIMRLLNKIAFLEGRIGENAQQNELLRLDAAEELIERINGAGVLTDGDLCEVLKLAKCQYTDASGEKKPWLSKREAEQLCIRKGTLTEQERLVMENHVSLTAKLLAEICFSKEYKRVPLWASSHHEFLDGTGYPHHLKGKDIPFEVRILTILDIFDALTADDRPYKPGIPVEQALLILSDMAEREGKLDAILTKQFTESRCWE